MRFKEFITESGWIKEVKTKKTPPEGLFISGSVDDILTWVLKTHKNLKSAMSSVSFYINRAGDNLSASRKKVLETVKNKIQTHFEE